MNLEVGSPVECRYRKHYSAMRAARLEGVRERAWYSYLALLDNLPRGLADADEAEAPSAPRLVPLDPLLNRQTV